MSKFEVAPPPTVIRAAVAALLVVLDLSGEVQF